MDDTEVVVIGAGLFGSVIAHHLTSQGRQVVTIDAGLPMSGSAPAACLMKPGWASSMSAQEYHNALRLLGDITEVLELPFRVGPITTNLHWVPPSHILVPPMYKARVTRLVPEAEKVWLQTDEGWDMLAKKVVVATGHWMDLLPEIKVQPKGGWAFTWVGKLKERFIRPWAPYKQLVAFNRAPGEIWVGDGTALKPSSMEDRERGWKSRVRCAEAVGLDPAMGAVIAGYRPYVEGLKAPALVAEARPNVWVATGGAKNGTLGAAWAARQLGELM